MEDKTNRTPGYLKCIGDTCPVCGRAFAVPLPLIMQCRKMGVEYPKTCEECRKKRKGGK